MEQAVQRVDRFVKERRETDKPLVSWTLYFLLLSWVTFGIYPLVVFVRRISRADAFAARKYNYYTSVLDYTKQYAEECGKSDLVHAKLGDVESELKTAFDGNLRPIKAGVSLLLSFVTLGIYGLYVIYRLDKFWWDVQVVEQDFDESVSQVWTTLGIVRYPVTFEPNQSVRRSFGMYLLLSFVTFGVWGIVWDYKIHTDPDKLFPEFHSSEDAVLAAVRSASPDRSAATA